MNYLPNALNSDTISLRFSLNFCRSESFKFFGRFCVVSIFSSNLPEYRIFKAVPSPWTYCENSSIIKKNQNTAEKNTTVAQYNNLKFPPKPTFVASNTIHDFWYIAELVSKISLQLCGGSAIEHNTFTKMRWKWSGEKKSKSKFTYASIENEFIRTHSMIFKISFTAVCTDSSSSSSPVKYGSLRKNGPALARARNSNK